MSTWFRDTEESRRALAEERLIIAATELVCEALEQRGVSRSWLAGRLGVKLSEVSQRLSGRRNLTLRSFARMLHELGYTLELGAHDDQGFHRPPAFRWAREMDWPQSNMRYTQTHIPVRVLSGGRSAA